MSPKYARNLPRLRWGTSFECTQRAWYVDPLGRRVVALFLIFLESPNMTIWKTPLSLFCALLLCAVASVAHAQEARMLKDINPSSGSDPLYLTRMGDKIYFNASDGSVGRELWVTDGTNMGTELVRDINPGGSESSPDPSNTHNFSWERRFTIMNNRLWFTAHTNNDGRELWSSDGTNGGTSQVRDIWGGSGSSNISYITTDGNRLWWRARYNWSSNYEIWTTDNTNSADQREINCSSNNGDPRNCYAYNGICYYDGYGECNYGSSYRDEPFYATSNSQGPIADVYSGSNGSYPDDFIELGGSIYFSGQNGTYGRELYKCTGTGNLELVKDINPGGGSSDARYMVKLGNVLIFAANDGQNGMEIWRSDGTPNGTFMVRNIRPFGSSSDPWGLTVVDDKVYFRANDGDHGEELWVTDGTQAGTRMVADIRNGSGSSSPQWMADVNGTCYFVADDGYNGRELWRVRGNGAQMVADIYNGSLSSNPEYLVFMNGVLYFCADDGINGRELWHYGVPPEVSDISPGRNELHVAADTDIELEYDQAIEPMTVDASSFRIHSSVRGVRDGMRSSNMTDLALDPTANFAPGAIIEVTATNGLQNGFMIPAIPETFRFRVAAGMGPAEFSTVNARTFGAAADQASAIRLGDIDGDGSPDVVVGTMGGANTIYFNDGNGNFGASTSTVGGASDNVSDVALGDIDADGDLDIVLALQGGYNAAYLNDGSGDFSGAQNYLPFGPGYDDSRALALGDLNRDGFLDVVIANYNEPNLVHMNDGNGNFAFDTTVIGSYSDDTLDVAIGDMNSDGSLDVVLANEHQTGYVYLNDGDGDFTRNELRRQYGTAVIFPVVRYAVSVADLNDDGFLDIISGNFGQRNHIYLNDKGANFPTLDVELINVDDTVDVSNADIDGDGDIDVLVANQGQQSFAYLNDGMGTGLAGPSPVRLLGSNNQQSVSLDAADVDGDGDIDVASAGFGSQSYVVLNQSTMPTAPSITSTPAADAVVGQPYSYTIQATGFPSPNFSVSGNPAWLTLNGAVLSGTPTANDIGVSAIMTVTAANGVNPDDSQMFSINVTQPMTPTEPMISSTAVTSAAEGRVYTYDIVVSGFPTPTLSVSGNPAWLTLSGTTLSGTPTSNDVGETGDIMITAANGVGNDATQTFKITVTQEIAPSIDSQPGLEAEVGEVYTYTILTSGSPAPTITVMDLPSWLTFSGNTITGIPAGSDAGPDGVMTGAEITITASNGVGTDAAQSFSITVIDRSRLVAPRFISLPTTFVSVDSPYSYSPSFVGNPMPTIDVQGLPDWLSWDGTTMSGIPAEGDAGITGPITVTIENSSGQDAMQVFQITVLLQRDVVVNTESVESGSCALIGSGTNSLWLLLLIVGALVGTRALKREDA